ncbi:MAG: hypothetical protein ACXAC2_09550, partial [Candidatus Kariarchaeaceae archaeon]
MILIRYYSPVKKGIGIGIGKLYFENKGYNYEAHSDIPKAEFMLVNVNSTKDYSEFMNDYYYQDSIYTTPFDTEYSGSFMAMKYELDLSALYSQEGTNSLDFSNIIFSVPDPSYELTINEVLILEESVETSTQTGALDSRVWQYTEAESFEASPTPQNDKYHLTLTNTPLFYPDSEWIDYLNIFDEDGNYYTAGITGNDHQLHYEPSSNNLTWNPTFNQFPEYFGMKFEEPMLIEANKTLYIQYATNTSWSEAIRIEVENIDLQSIRAIYDYNYLLKPEYYDWYGDLYGVDHSYENIAYSLKDEVEYEVVQYYYETFTVYTNIAQYNHTFDIGNFSFSTDFVNLSLQKVIGLTPNFTSEILTDNADYTVVFNEATKNVTITDLNAGNGLLDSFDHIMVILNYSYGPISSFTEVYLLDQFNQTYLSDPKDTFYNYIDIDYRFSAESGTALLAESAAIIVSDTTSFTSIDYCRNPDVSSNSKLNNYGTEIFDYFEVYMDESSVIYTADVDMDGEMDYKQTLDINKDQNVDIVKYGIDDPEVDGEIIWHTIIQDFRSVEVSTDTEEKEELRTLWFDINDRGFANFDFNVAKLLFAVLVLPLLTLYIAKMILPDVDYWAQKSTQQVIEKEEYKETEFYSVTLDDDRDGIADSQVSYERIKSDTYYEVTEYKKTILAAKYQNVFTFITEYSAKSFSSFFGAKRSDPVFNGHLTEEHLDTQDFSDLNSYTQTNAPILRATYRKFTENITTRYVDSFERTAITVIDFDEEGEIEEQRIYTDSFVDGDVDNVAQFFSEVSEEHSVTSVDTGYLQSVSFD